MELCRICGSPGTTIILTTHYLEEAESLCRTVAIIDEGTIIEDAKMSTILRKLQREVFVLSVRDALEKAPDLSGFETSLRDNCEIEVVIDSDHTINDLFVELSRHSIDVMSMRNKTNRLEELFMRLVDSKKASSTGTVGA